MQWYNIEQQQQEWVVGDALLLKAHQIAFIVQTGIRPSHDKESFDNN